MPRMKQLEGTAGENNALATALPRGPLSDQLVSRNNFTQIPPSDCRNRQLETSNSITRCETAAKRRQIAALFGAILAV